MTIPQSPSSKSALRKAMRQVLRNTISDPAPACAALGDRLSARPGVRTVAIYSVLPGEVDLSAVRSRLPEITWVFPRILGDHLTFHVGGRLEPGAHGILEPHADMPEIPLREIDVFVCPGLAFDTQGHRLGRGRGFYDRLLAQARPDALKIGICFPFQIVPDTFAEPHDVRMDEVIYG